MNWKRAALLFLFGTAIAEAFAQAPPKPTILAVGAHAGDMELTTGAFTAEAVRRG